MKQARNLSQDFNRKSISRNTTHRMSLNLKVMLTDWNLFVLGC